MSCLPWLVGINLLKTAIGDMNNKLENQIKTISLYACLSVCQRRDRSGWQIA